MKPPAGASASVAPGTKVTAHFQPIQQLMAGEQGKTPLDDILRSIAAIEQHLGTLGPEVGAGDPMDLLSSPALRALLSSLKQQSQTLPPAIRVLVDQIADLASGTLIPTRPTRSKRNINRRCWHPAGASWQIDIRSHRTVRADVALADFGTVFGSDGVFDRFFKDYLENQVDTSRRPWSWRPGSIRPSSRMLETFEAAYAVREIFFAKGSQTPALNFWVTVANLDPSASRFILQIDGQNLDGTHKVASKIVGRVARSGARSGCRDVREQVCPRRGAEIDGRVGVVPHG